MKHYLILGVMIFAAETAYGNPYANMSPEEMQKLMMQAQKMQACMQGVDPAAMTRLQQKSQKMEQEIRALCQAGKRDEAEATAMKYGMEISKDKDVQEMQKCGSEIQAVIGGAMQFTQLQDSGEDEYEDKHLCEGM